MTVLIFNYMTQFNTFNASRYLDLTILPALFGLMMQQSEYCYYRWLNNVTFIIFFVLSSLAGEIVPFLTEPLLQLLL